MSDKTYDIIKIIAQLILPAIAALYASLAGIWGFPFAEAIVGTISAVDVFLGALLKIKSDEFWENKTTVTIAEDDDSDKNSD